ncbi:MAG: acyltransferase [Bacilli bacterium]
MITKLMMLLQRVKYGKNLKIKGFSVIVNKGKIEMGDNVILKSSIFSNLIGLYQRTIITTRTPNSVIKIGNNVGMSGTTIYAREYVSIGDNTLIGANAKIIDNDFHPIEIDARNKNDTDKIGVKPVIIGKNCFIGCNVIILKGTILEDGCVVGAGSVVSGKFEANSVIVGNPGKVVRKNDLK